MITPGVYRHYKGDHYRVFGVGKHSETGEVLVYYQALYGEHEMWFRPLSMFCEEVLHENETVKRFTPISVD